MATEEQTNTEELVVSRAGIVPDAELQRLERRIAKEERKLRKLERESQNVFYGEEVDTTAVDEQSALIQTLKDQRDILIEQRSTQFVTYDKASALERANQDVINAANEVVKLKAKAQAREEIPVSGGKGFVTKQKVTAEVVAQAEKKLEEAKARVEQIKTGKTAEELAEEASQGVVLRGSAGTQAADFGAPSGAERQDTTPLMDGMVNIGTINAPTRVDLPGGGALRSFQKRTEPQTIEFAQGLFYSTSQAGTDLKNKIRETLAASGITDVSDSKLESYWKEALTATAAANQADNPNQTVWDTLAIIGKSGSGESGTTGPSAEAIKAKKESVRLLATQLGVTLTDNQINDLAYRFANGELDSTTINFRIAKIGEIDFAAGEAANTINDLKTKAAEYGILYSPDWYTKSTRKVLTGEIDQDTIDQQIRDLAKSQFPTLSAQIDEGYTVKQIASPYIQSMAAILEIDPTTIGLQDLSIKQALTGVDMDGKPTTKPLWLFEQDLRKDPRWNYTKNAQEATMGVARRVLQDFGLAY